MIAAFAVIFTLSLAMGWRGYEFSAFWNRIYAKCLATAGVMAVLALSIEPIGLLISFPSTYVFLACIAFAGFLLGATMKLTFRRRI